MNKKDNTHRSFGKILEGQVVQPVCSLDAQIGKEICDVIAESLNRKLKNGSIPQDSWWVEIISQIITNSEK